MNGKIVGGFVEMTVVTLHEDQRIVG